MKDYWEHAERQTRPLRPPEEELALRPPEGRQYYYRRKFRIAKSLKKQIAAKVSQACPGCRHDCGWTHRGPNASSRVRDSMLKMRIFSAEINSLEYAADLLRQMARTTELWEGER